MIWNFVFVGVLTKSVPNPSCDVVSVDNVSFLNQETSLPTGMYQRIFIFIFFCSVLQNKQPMLVFAVTEICAKFRD
jgi:hypothetical protein